MRSRTANLLTRLYPRPWRERYGEEFADLVQARRLTAWALIDIVSGALDARLSSTARISRLGVAPANNGAVMIDALKRSCARTGFPFTARDGIVGGCVIVGGTILFAALGNLLRRYGWTDLAAYVRAMSLFAALTLALPVTFLKGQPWRAQVAIVGGTMAILVVIALA